LFWNALERKGGKHNFELEGFNLNFKSLAAVLGQA
jgi:hypothetical protein